MGKLYLPKGEEVELISELYGKCSSQEIKIKAGDFLKFSDKNSPNITYVEALKISDILPECGGGFAMQANILTGGWLSIPLSQIKEIKKFNSIAEMQEDINTDKQTDFS